MRNRRLLSSTASRSQFHSLLGSGLVLAVAGTFLLSACYGTDRKHRRYTDSGDGGSTTVGSGGTTNVGVGGNSGTTSSSMMASSSTGSNPCTYPQGPYGVNTGQTVPPNLSWQAYAPNTTDVVTLTMADLFDCDGQGQRDVILVDTSQFG